MAMVRLSQLLLICLFCGVAGCVGNAGRALTPKEWGDKLENVRLGALISELAASIPQFDQNSSSRRLDEFALGSFALADPSSNPPPTMYRQYPRGVLLTITAGDYYKNVDFYDGFESVAAFVVFFDSNDKYKGYFGYASNLRSRDSKERLKAEQQSYKDLKVAETLKAEIDLATGKSGRRGR